MDTAPAALRFLVQHYAQERSVDLQATIVLDESQFSELVHEEIDARARFRALNEVYGEMKNTIQPGHGSPPRSFFLAVPHGRLGISNIARCPILYSLAEILLIGCFSYTRSAVGFATGE